MPLLETKLPDLSKSWDDLSVRLHIRVETLWAYRKRPGAPQDKSFRAWKEYLAKEGIGHHASKKKDAAEKGRNLALKNELLELQIAKVKGEMIPRSEVGEMLLMLITRQKAILYQSMENELPVSCAGLPIAESRVKHRDAADRICDEMLKVSVRVGGEKKPAPTEEAGLDRSDLEEEAEDEGPGDE
jgi:hypothetical protein